MSTVEILDVSLVEASSEQLWGCYIEAPKPGSQANGNAINVSGWVLGRRCPAVAVELVQDSAVVGSVPVNVRRPDVADDFTEVAGAEQSGFQTTVRVLSMRPEIQLLVRAVLQDGSRVLIGMIRAWHHGHVMEPSDIKEELKDLILKVLRTQYMSKSKDGTKTGNHYQSVTLGEMKTTGFRTDRREFLDQIDFEGKKVLDLGSNLGEVSRAAWVRGAYLVDGFEYDKHFLETAELINAYNDVTRVSFYQRDITDPSVYDEQYDVVLAFSVFAYVRSVLKQIAAITNQLFVLETHKLEENLDSNYLKPILQYFPHYKVLGESEWGIPQDASERRAVIAFTKEESALTVALNVPHLVSTEVKDPDRTWTNEGKARARIRWRNAKPEAGLTWGKELTGEAFVSKLESYACFDEETTVLEVGPGYGRILRSFLAQGLPFKEYYAVDTSEQNIEYLRKQFPQANIHFIHADIEDASLPFQFDVGFSSLTFKHLYPSFETALRNCSRYMNPGGRFVFDLLEGAQARFSASGPTTYVRWYSREEVLTILGNAGLELVAFDEVIHDSQDSQDSQYSRLLVITSPLSTEQSE